MSACRSAILAARPQKTCWGLFHQNNLGLRTAAVLLSNLGSLLWTGLCFHTDWTRGTKDFVGSHSEPTFTVRNQLGSFRWKRSSPLVHPVGGRGGRTSGSSRRREEEPLGSSRRREGRKNSNRFFTMWKRPLCVFYHRIEEWNQCWRQRTVIHVGWAGSGWVELVQGGCIVVVHGHMLQVVMVGSGWLYWLYGCGPRLLDAQQTHWSMVRCCPTSLRRKELLWGKQRR